MAKAGKAVKPYEKCEQWVVECFLAQEQGSGVLRHVRSTGTDLTIGGRTLAFWHGGQVLVMLNRFGSEPSAKSAIGWIRERELRGLLAVEWELLDEYEADQNQYRAWRRDRRDQRTRGVECVGSDRG